MVGASKWSRECVQTSKARNERTLKHQHNVHDNANKHRNTKRVAQRRQTSKRAHRHQATQTTTNTTTHPNTHNNFTPKEPIGIDQTECGPLTPRGLMSGISDRKAPPLEGARGWTDRRCTRGLRPVHHGAPIHSVGPPARVSAAAASAASVAVGPGLGGAGDRDPLRRLPWLRGIDQPEASMEAGSRATW
jgi:hypothetical protein